ncbi:hypothetical protein GW17_00001751 [Ensete ventricosum]|nr:hypothetical protein GW17_00001751 [Ensete ventricosum]
MCELRTPESQQFQRIDLEREGKREKILWAMARGGVCAGSRLSSIRLTWHDGSTEDCVGARERCVGWLLPGRDPFALGRGMSDSFRSGRTAAVTSDRWVTMRVQR